MTPARSQIVGQSLEDMLNFAHSLYLNRGEAWVKHNEIRGRFRSRRDGRAEFTPSPAKGAPDYYGCVDGRMIAFDAKSTSNKKTWMLDGRRVHQYLDLCEIAAAGGVCWFAVEHRLSQTLYLLRVDAPFPETAFQHRVPKLDFTRDALPPDVITVAYEEGYYDWLSVVWEHWLTPDPAPANELDDFIALASKKRWLRHADLCGVHLISKGNRCTCGLSVQLEAIKDAQAPA